MGYLMNIKTTFYRWFGRSSIAALAFVPIGCATANTPEQPTQTEYERNVQIEDFVTEMVRDHGFTPSALKTVLGKAEKKQSILDAISRPAEKTLEWKGYRKIFITDKRITGGVRFMRKHRAVLERAEMVYGVPKEIITAIIGVETYYGRMAGNYRVVDALSTLAFDYPPRAEFFRSQLKEYFILAREESIDPLSIKGSYAGAMGYGQFIPSSYRNFAVDFDGDKKRDIWNNPTDAIGSVANYFKEHHWQTGEPVVVPATVQGDAYNEFVNTNLKPELSVQELAEKGFMPKDRRRYSGMATAMELQGEKGVEHWLGLRNFYVITRYNHSKLYAMAVYQLSQKIKQADQQG